MTCEEQKQYDALPNNSKSSYNRIKSENPHWSHKQIMFKVSLEKKIDDTVEGKGIDVDPEDPIFWNEILKGAKDFLQGIGCVIREIFDAIDQAVDKLTGWVARGASAVVDEILDIIF